MEKKLFRPKGLKRKGKDTHKQEVDSLHTKSASQYLQLHYSTAHKHVNLSAQWYANNALQFLQNNIRAVLYKANLK